jgi:hypothetical protein
MADAIDAAGWVSPDTHRRAVDEAREQGAGDTDRLIRDAVRRAEAERDDWKRRHARVQEMYRERFNAGLRRGGAAMGRVHTPTER